MTIAHDMHGHTSRSDCSSAAVVALVRPAVASRFAHATGQAAREDLTCRRPRTQRCLLPSPLQSDGASGGLPRFVHRQVLPSG